MDVVPRSAGLVILQATDRASSSLLKIMWFRVVLKVSLGTGHKGMDILVEGDFKKRKLKKILMGRCLNNCHVKILGACQEFRVWCDHFP